MSKKVITLLIIVYTGVLLALLHQARKPLCIDSMVVEKIDRISEQKGQQVRESVWGCNFKMRETNYSPFFANRIFEISKRIKLMEKIYQQIALPISEPVKIIVVDHKNRFFKTLNNQILISEDLFLSSQFEKILTYSLLSQMNIFKKEDEMTIDSISGFVTYLAIQNEEVVKDAKSPFFTKKVIGEFNSYAADEKYFFLKDLWNQPILSELNYKNTKFDYMIIDKNQTAELKLKKHDYQRFKIARIDNHLFWHMPFEAPLLSSKIGEIKTQHLIYEKCEPFKIDQIVKYLNIADKILIVENCEKQKINYSGYIKEGLEAFAQENKGIRFLQIHVSSLLMKQEQLKNISDVFDLIRTQDKMSQTSIMLGWQGLDYNQKIGMYRPLAVIDGIQAFR